MKQPTTLTRYMSLIGAAFLACCANPYFNKEIQRAEHPVTIRAEYMAYACGEFFPQLKPIGLLPGDLDTSLLDGGLTFWVPAEFAAPDQIDELGVAGNQFELQGYYHYVEEDGRRYMHPRFDLYAWRPLLPYRVWRFDLDKDDEPAPREFVTSYREEPDGWHRLENEPKSPEAYQFARRYDGCL